MTTTQVAVVLAVIAVCAVAAITAGTAVIWGAGAALIVGGVLPLAGVVGFVLHDGETN